MSDFDLKVLARKIVAFLLSILFGSLKYYFTLLSPPQAHAVTVACAGLQSTLFIWLNVWYISHLVKRPYISGRKSQTLGDPLNDADMLTTRVFIWSSTMLALSSVFRGQQEGGSEKVNAAIMNVLCGVILVALIWPQRLLFLGLRQSINELWTREERSDEDEETKLVLQMMKAKGALELFALQRELLKRNDLSAIERARWTSKAAAGASGSSQEESGTRSDNCSRCNKWSACLESLNEHRAGRVALRILRLLVGGAAVASTVWAAIAVLKFGVVGSPDARSQYVWVSTAVLSAVLSEVLRMRWKKSWNKTALERHSSFVRSDTIDEKGILSSRKSEQKAVELVEVRVGSVGSVYKEDAAAENEKADESKGGVTMVINPMAPEGQLDSA